MTGDEDFEVGDEITLTPEGEVCVGQLLDRGQVELVQPGDLVLGERVEGEVGERRAPPEAERLTEERRRLERRARGERRARFREQRREAVRVELSVLDPEDVPGRPGQEDASASAAAGPNLGVELVFEHLAKP